MTVPEVHEEEKSGSISCPPVDDRIYQRTSLPLLMLPPILWSPEQSSNKTKATLDPLRRTKGIKVLNRAHRHQHLWSTGLLNRRTGSIQIHASSEDTPWNRANDLKLENQHGPLNTTNFIFFLNHKRSVGGKNTWDTTKQFCARTLPLFRKFRIYRKCYYNNPHNTPMGLRQN